MLFHGQHLIGSSSSTQNVVVLSSGESEYYGLVKTCSRLLGLQAPAPDFGLVLAAQVYVDSTACKRLASCSGVGLPRGCNPQYKRSVTIQKVAGTENPADLGTKHLAAPAMLECLRRSGLRLEQGQSVIALQVAVKLIQRHALSQPIDEKPASSCETHFC